MTKQHKFYNETDLERFLSCKDHTVSGEEFEVRYHPDYDMGITVPQPEPEELSKYYESDAYISHTDSQKSLFDKIYQAVKNITIKQKVSLIERQNLQGKTLLDIGCGTGDFLAASQISGWEVYGIEPSKKAREKALEKLTDKAFLFDDIAPVIQSGKQYDVITMWHVLEHIPNLTEYIGFLKQLLKPGGVLIIAVPNFKSYDAVYYGSFWAAYDVPRHLWHFSKKAIQMLFHQHGFKVVKILPMKFDAFYVSLLSEKYKTGQSNPLRTFWVGLRSNIKARSKNQYSSLIYLIKHTKKPF